MAKVMVNKRRRLSDKPTYLKVCPRCGSGSFPGHYEVKDFVTGETNEVFLDFRSVGTPIEDFRKEPEVEIDPIEVAFEVTPSL